MRGKLINPERSTELSGHESTFYDLARDLSLHYEDPRFFEQADISFTGQEQVRGQQRQFPMFQEDGIGRNFEFRLPDYRYFRNDCGRLFGEVGGEVFSNLDEATRKLYIGCGLAQVFVQKDILKYSEDEVLLERFENLFADRAEIAALFNELAPPETGEVEPVWVQIRHIMGKGVYTINAIRASAAYLFEALSVSDGGEFAATIVTESRKALFKQLNGGRWDYLELAIMRFNQSQEIGNEVFMNGIPEWLIAFALPMEISRLRDPELL